MDLPAVAARYLTSDGITATVQDEDNFTYETICSGRVSWTANTIQGGVGVVECGSDAMINLRFRPE